MEDIELQVLAYVRVNPRVSMRHVSFEIFISHNAVHKILKKHKFHPYRPDLVQNLRQGDAEHESKFTNNGVINKQNNRYRYTQNPHWVIETNNQCIWGTNIWCGLIGSKLLGPYFYDGTLNGRRYLEFLMNKLPIMPDDIPLSTRNNLILQQDGSMPRHIMQLS
ncbi:Hypothetical protein CINCED_3A018245 [Cinara cedri]|uniref:Uncharacterized protein n=1 Tax=Cinara cedri TaxID=506608 RepID=A0A5E4NDL5_9HEMI|nr:Hypothetical protein CINCED_3A018245 [Cinara cedri]